MSLQHMQRYYILTETDSQHLEERYYHIIKILSFIILIESISE